jgi:hypothetical protein
LDRKRLIEQAFIDGGLMRDAILPVFSRPPGKDPTAAGSSVALSMEYR